ncbi:MAG TPA: glycosyltransferase family 39 protein, partial [Oceanobacillus sp.]|nr:glycosyltransferase family 39 protein [Oceanobacillus sp.]
MQSTKERAGMLVRAIIVLLALMILLTAYYWVHKPFDLTTITILGGAALDTLTVGALFAIAGGIGRWGMALLQQRLALDFTLLSRAERFALAGIAGLMLISSAVLALGMVGLFRNVFFWIPLLVIGVLLRHEVKTWLEDGRAILVAARPQTRWGWILAAFSVTLLVLALLHSLAPPYAWDGMTYHLVGPSHYLADGRITPQPENAYFGFPKAVEMLFSVVMSLFGRDTAAAPVHVGFGILGFLAVGGLTRRYADSSIESAWLAVSLLIGSFSLWLVMTWTYVDLAVLALSTLAFSLVNVWRETKDSRWLILLGFLCGFSLTIKYTVGLLIGALGLYILVYQPLRNVLRQPHQLIRDVLFFGLPIIVAFLPWMIRAALHYNNPFYPYFFDGLNWNSERALYFNQVGMGLLSHNLWWQLPIMPIAATIFGV